MWKIKNVFTLGPTAQATEYTSIHDFLSSVSFGLLEKAKKMSKVWRCISNLEDFHDLAFDEWKNQQQKSSHLDLDVLLKDTQIPINIAWLVFIVCTLVLTLLFF